MRQDVVDGTDHAVLFDTNGGVASYSTGVLQNPGGTASGWLNVTLQLIAVPSEGEYTKPNSTEWQPFPRITYLDINGTTANILWTGQGNIGSTPDSVFASSPTTQDWADCFNGNVAVPTAMPQFARVDRAYGRAVCYVDGSGGFTVGHRWYGSQPLTAPNTATEVVWQSPPLRGHNRIIATTQVPAAYDQIGVMRDSSASWTQYIDSANYKIDWLEPDPAPVVTHIASATGIDGIATMPAHSVNDVLIAFGFLDGSNTLPTVPSGWTSIDSTTGSSMGAVVAYKIATSTAEVSGTWTGATALAISVYRGVKHSNIGVGTTKLIHTSISVQELTSIFTRFEEPKFFVKCVGTPVANLGINVAAQVYSTATTAAFVQRASHIDATNSISVGDSSGLEWESGFSNYNQVGATTGVVFNVPLSPDIGWDGTISFNNSTVSTTSYWPQATTAVSTASTVTSAQAYAPRFDAFKLYANTAASASNYAPVASTQLAFASTAASASTFTTSASARLAYLSAGASSVAYALDAGAALSPVNYTSSATSASAYAPRYDAFKVYSSTGSGSATNTPRYDAFTAYDVGATWAVLGAKDGKDYTLQYDAFTAYNVSTVWGTGQRDGDYTLQYDAFTMYSSSAASASAYLPSADAFKSYASSGVLDVIYTTNSGVELTPKSYTSSATSTVLYTPRFDAFKGYASTSALTVNHLPRATATLSYGSSSVLSATPAPRFNTVVAYSSTASSATNYTAAAFALKSYVSNATSAVNYTKTASAQVGYSSVTTSTINYLALATAVIGYLSQTFGVTNYNLVNVGTIAADKLYMTVQWQEWVTDGGAVYPATRTADLVATFVSRDAVTIAQTQVDAVSIQMVQTDAVTVSMTDSDVVTIAQ